MSALDYLPPEGMSPALAAETLAQQFPLRDGHTIETDRTFYDTFDGLLHHAGLSLVSEGSELRLLDRATGELRAQLRDAPGTAGSERLFAFELPPGPLRDALVPVSEVRALTPVARVHARERRLGLLDDERKTVVRLAFEQPKLVLSARRRVALRARLHLAAVRGYERELDHARELLEGALGFTAAEAPLVDEAVHAAGGTPGGFSSKLELALDPGQRADAAAAAVLRALLRVIEANYDGTVRDLDSEFLHDLRVAVRRSRAVQRELRGVFAPAELARFRTEFRWLQQVTGDARDLDVYVLEFDRFRALVPPGMRSDLDPVLDVLHARRLDARTAMVKALRSARARTLRSQWAQFLDGLERLPEEQRPDAAAPIVELAGARIRKVHRRMVRMGGAIDDASPAEDYHELRKKGKELRYLLELFGASLHPPEVVKPMIKALKGLQDVLGRHQDREVQVGMLRSLRDEVLARPGGADALIAMGALVARLHEEELAARRAFAEQFAEFASKAQRKLVKETFG
jgi:CHAD domain-containing protein